MPMLCPSIPIDKNKKGGRNYDSSKLTDFKKICLISNDDTTKPNQQTDLTELRRGSLLASSLLTIPGFVPTILSPAPAPTVNVNTEILSDSLIGDLTGITFYVWYTFGDSNYNSDNNILKYNTTVADNEDAILDSTVKGPADSISDFSSKTREAVVAKLDEKLNQENHKLTPTSRLKASLTFDGKLRLTIEGTQLPTTGYYSAGLFFGDASNGSTTLGITREEDEEENKDGIAGASLLIFGNTGATSVTAPYKIGGGV
jgi:hypothetical protein